MLLKIYDYDIYIQNRYFKTLKRLQWISLNHHNHHQILRIIDHLLPIG